MLLDSEVGECVCTRLKDGRVRVDKADPIIHIANELLESKDFGGIAAGVVIEGDLVAIGDDNLVIYRITERGAREVEAVMVFSSGID